MSTDSRVLSSSHENLFGGQRSSRLSGITGLLQPRKRASEKWTLNSDFDKMGRVNKSFGLHYFKPAHNGFFNVGDGFIVSITLRETSGECRNFSHKITGLVLFNDYMQFHRSSFKKRYHKQYMQVKKHGGGENVRQYILILLSLLHEHFLNDKFPAMDEIFVNNLNPESRSGHYYYSIGWQ